MSSRSSVRDGFPSLLVHSPRAYMSVADEKPFDCVNNDDKELLALGYKPSFRREFTNLATISFAFSILGLPSSVAMTLNTPLLLGGPSSVVWCWILGATMCFTLGSSIAEIVSAYPTCGGLYTASAYLVPKHHRARVGWLVGWLNILGQIAGLSSTEFGLASMILAAVSVGTNGTFEITAGKTVGLSTGLLIIQGLLNSLTTRRLAQMTKGFVFVNLGITFVIIIALLAKTPRSDMQTADHIFGAAGIVNQTGGWNTGLAFLFGLLSVQWTMTDYDATAHISEEVRRAAYAAPSAIFIAVVGTGLLGWLLNIVLMLCSGPLEDLPGLSGSAFLQILVLRLGTSASLIIWVFVCMTAFSVAQTGLQAMSRAVYAFSRDHGLPDGGYFGKISNITHTPLRAVWFSTIASIFPVLLDLASPVAANAIFSVATMALDLSYIIPIFCRRVYHSHPDVMFKPGPFYMGDGWMGLLCNSICISWTLFISVIFSIPTNLPVTKLNMNYASVIIVGVIVVAYVWYFAAAYKHYDGPKSNLDDDSVTVIDQDFPTKR